MKSLHVLGIMMSLCAGGCAAYGGALLLPVPMEVSSPSGFVLRSPDAIQTPTGTRFHGAVCRKSSMLSPTRVRVDRLGARGDVLASASRPLGGLGGRGRRCTFYEVPTDWTIGAGESVRVCALRSDSPCPPTPSPGRPAS